MNVLHVIPEFAFANTYHGTYKDVSSRVRWFEQNAETYTQVRVAFEYDVSNIIRQLPQEAPDAILVEYTHFPELLRMFRRRFPAARIAVRAINIEPLQHLDNHGWWPRRGPIWLLYGMSRLLLQDTRCRIAADVVYAISDYEARHYWKRLPGRASVEWLPYVCPDHLLGPDAADPPTERRVVACMPTSQKSRKSWDLVVRFIRFAERMQAAGSGMKFVVTGAVSEWGLPHTTAVQFTGMLDDLRTFLPSVRAVAVLSPLGYGFKTTMVDAMANGASVIAHPAQVRRCPAGMLPHMLPLDTERAWSAADMERKLNHLSSPVHAQQSLRSHGERILERDFSAAAETLSTPGGVPDARP